MSEFTNSEEQRARSIWNNKKIPIFLRRGKDSLRLRIPYNPSNRDWLRTSHRQHAPVWDKEGRYWELPKSRFNQLVEQILDKFGSLYIIQPYREMEKCSPSCISAQGFECTCSCMGANHGSHNHSEWFEVSEAFAFRYGESHLACRLLQKL